MLFNKMTLNNNNLERCKNQRTKYDNNLEKANNKLIVFKGDEEINLKHAFQHSLIYYRNQRIKIKV